MQNYSGPLGERPVAVLLTQLAFSVRKEDLPHDVSRYVAWCFFPVNHYSCVEMGHSYFMYWNVNKSGFFSLHTHSVWETICDALASWSGWKFGSKIPVYPILGLASQNTPPECMYISQNTPPTIFMVVPHAHWGTMGNLWYISCKCIIPCPDIEVNALQFPVLQNFTRIKSTVFDVKVRSFLLQIVCKIVYNGKYKYNSSINM